MSSYYMAQTLINSPTLAVTESGSTTLWVGLNDGSIYGYQVVVPCQSARQEEDVSALLGLFML